MPNCSAAISQVKAAWAAATTIYRPAFSERAISQREILHSIGLLHVQLGTRYG